MAPKAPPKGRTSIKGTCPITILEWRKPWRNIFRNFAKRSKKSKSRQIYKWLKKEKEIRRVVQMGGAHLQKIRVKRAKRRIYCSLGTRSTPRGCASVLDDKAKKVADDADIPPASLFWKKRFLAKFRFSLHCKTRIGQITPADSAQVVQKFRLEVLKTIEEEGIVEVFNADQTAMNYEYLPTRTHDTKCTRTVWVHNAGAEKKRMPVMLLSDMHGNRKTPFAVFKQPPSTVPTTEIYNHQNSSFPGVGSVMDEAKQMREAGEAKEKLGLWAEVKQLMDKHDVQIYGNAKGWWNQRLLFLWLQHDFGSRDNLGKKCVKMYAAMIGVVLLKIPPGYTASCQPADIAWIKPFNLVLRSLWVDHLQSQPRAHQERGSQTQFKLETPSRATLMAWLTRAWEGLPAATLESGFRKLSIPTDNRVLASRDPVMHDIDIGDLVDQLEALRWCEEVGTDFGL
ncbi:LOW QUALITY PROTEIN: hypothetical protein PHMEG_00019818 [Phytophthora megakarya]|uniref:DDE-1 domain-containing protein n=1 Tax=Phytophthora megakarya TaxID=4795 RepID=A0A225VQY7_9STRA|nr:LOW QUALITY PROTEIN: hypothetical protein PHMEG_00019818 [Phytophthora megakarya]